MAPQVLECAVDPAHQCKGIGSALLEHMLLSHRWAFQALAA